MFTTLSQFYNSPEWLRFRRTVILERLTPSGDTIDELTGRPITERYDVILHHITPLTTSNVNDYSVSLNPDNIMILSHESHNVIHQRFGQWTRHIYLVTGCYCAGKSTFVSKVATPSDLVVDIDRLYDALTVGGRSERLLGNVMDCYNLMVDSIAVRKGAWVNAYVMRALPYRSDRERLRERLGAELIEIDTDEETCLSRADETKTKLVKEYWRRYDGKIS